MDIGRVGIWTFQLDLQPAAAAQAAARELEEQGWGAIWIPEALGREAFTNAAVLLAGTRRIPVALGIANIWARDAMAMRAAQLTLAEAYPERFLLGIGVSHAPLVEGVRGHRYERPLSAMRAYLDAMDRAPFLAARPAREPRAGHRRARPEDAGARRRAHGRRAPLLRPARAHAPGARDPRAAGSSSPPSRPSSSRRIPPSRAAVARAHMAIYLGLPNYQNNLRRLGFGDADFADGGSDRLVDAIVAWGDVDAVVARVRAHHDAGADHVCVQVLDPDPRALPMPQWRRLAKALL